MAIIRSGHMPTEALALYRAGTIILWALFYRALCTLCRMEVDMEVGYYPHYTEATQSAKYLMPILMSMTAGSLNSLRRSVIST